MNLQLARATKELVPRFARAVAGRHLGAVMAGTPVLLQAVLQFDSRLEQFGYDSDTRIRSYFSPSFPGPTARVPLGLLGPQISGPHRRHGWTLNVGYAFQATCLKEPSSSRQGPQPSELLYHLGSFSRFLLEIRLSGLTNAT